MSFTNRNSYSTNIAPSFATAATNCASRQSIDFTPFFRTLSYAINRHIRSRATVTGLFLPCSPLNIIWFVVSIIINAIKSVAWSGFSSYGSEKLFVRLKAKLNAPTTIFRKVWMVRVCTSVFRSTIGAIFRGYSFAFGVFFTMLPRIFFAVTSTGKDEMPSQYRPHNSSAIATVTKAVPSSGKGFVKTCKSKDEQSVKFLSCQNFNSGGWFRGIGTNGKLVSRHDVFSITENIVSSRLGESSLFLRAASVIIT